MTKNLFFEGPPGCGKTTLIFEMLGNAVRKAGGFAVSRLRREDGSIAGYCAVKACEFTGADRTFYAPDKATVFLEFAESGSVFKADALAAFICDSLRFCSSNVNGTRYDFLLMDEIGGAELVKDSVREALLQALDSDYPVIGVLKSRYNAQKEAAKLKIATDLQTPVRLKTETDLQTSAGLKTETDLQTPAGLKIATEWKSMLSGINGELCAGAIENPSEGKNGYLQMYDAFREMLENRKDTTIVEYAGASLTAMAASYAGEGCNDRILLPDGWRQTGVTDKDAAATLIKDWMVENHVGNI